MNLFPHFQSYTDNIYFAGRQPAFIMLIAFLITFILTRAYTRMARIKGWKSASFIGVHTHHIVFGLIIVLLSGAINFAFLPEANSPLNLILAVFFGGGAALILDEFALIFHLEDVYWDKEGRKSVDAIVIGLMLASLFLLQVTPLASSTVNFGTISILVIIITNLFFVIITALKGKMFLAIFGAFIPFIAQIGAIRLAAPNSIWAKIFYTRRSKKQKRSKKRYKHYAKRWKPMKEWLWDLIGGKPN